LKVDEARMLWRVLFGSQRGLIGVHSAFRSAPSSGRLVGHRTAFFAYPGRARAAAGWCLGASEEGLEAYFCAHLLTGSRRTKEYAAPVLALWADADGAPVPPEAPEPTAVVESSPGHAHLFWRLRRPVSPQKAEELNRRLIVCVGADRSGWDLTQLLRPPGTRNRKYADAPAVELIELDEGLSYHPRELELALPRTVTYPGALYKPAEAPCPEIDPSPTDLCRRASRLSARMRFLIERGNAGAGGPYPSRSEADFAVAVAMFGKGYSPEEVAAVLVDPSLGISEKALGEGPNTDNYVARTVRAASLAALPADPGLAAHKNTESSTEYR
jgi:hypothetical protein